MAQGKDLKTSIQIESGKAQRQIDKLIGKIKNITKAMDKVSNNEARLSPEIHNAVNETNKLKSATDGVANAAKSVTRASKQHGVILDSLITKAKRLGATYLGVMGAKAILGTADTITSAQNKLNNVNATQLGAEGVTTKNGKEVYSKATLNATNQQLDKIYNSANKVRGSYSGMISNVSKSMILAGDSFQNNIDNAIRFQEVMSEAYSVGGASAAEQASSMYQMIQALGSGVLQGDELKSVREGAQLAYEEIERFAQGVYNTNESLKEMASEGKITSDMVIAAILNAGDTIDAAFAKSAMTFAQAWQLIKNQAVHAFQPVGEALTNMLNSQVGRAVLNGIIVVINALGMAATAIINILNAVFTWIANNWNWFKYVAIAAIAIIAGYLTAALLPSLKKEISYIALAIKYYAYWGAVALVTAIRVIIGWMMVYTALTVVIAIIVVAIIAIVKFADATADAVGFIVGIISAAVSTIWTIFVTLVTFIVQSVLVPITTGFDTLANFCANVFQDPIATIIHMFEGMAQAVLGILQTIAKGIDKIFGSNLSSAVQGWSSKLSGKADALAKKYGNGNYTKVSNATGKLNDLLHSVQGKVTFKTIDAYNGGYKAGSSAVNWASEKLGGIGNAVSNKLNGIGKKLKGVTSNFSALNPNFDPTGLLNGGNGGPGSGGSGGSGGKGNSGKLSDIADDVADISDTLDLSESDLKYLRELAELEWKKEYTMPIINISMTNNNTVNNDRDLEGIVTKLTDVLYDELNNVASGVYAI